MDTKYIEFEKQRELGEILSDTFAFVRLKGKSLFSIILKLCGFQLILLLICSGFYAYFSTTIFKANLYQSLGSDSESLSNAAFMSISVIVMLLFYLVYYCSVFLTVMHFIKSYVTNKGTINTDQVSEDFKKDFLKSIGLGITCIIMIILGLCMCVIPGIYVSVPLTQGFSILVFKDLSIKETIKESFKIILNNWWITCVTIYVLYMIIGLIGAIFTLPSVIYGFISAIIYADKVTTANAAVSVDWITIVMNIISSAAQSLIIVLHAVAIAFIYFNLNERHNHTGVFKQIDALGKSE